LRCKAWRNVRAVLDDDLLQFIAGGNLGQINMRKQRCWISDGHARGYTTLGRRGSKSLGRKQWEREAVYVAMVEIYSASPVGLDIISKIT